MVAVVVNNKKRRKLHRLQFGNVVVLSAGVSVGKGRLRRALAPFGDGFVFASCVPTRGIVPFCTQNYKKDLLFYTFARHILSRSGLDLTVGIFDPEGRYFQESLPIINHCAEAKIVTEKSGVGFAAECLKILGTCPDITTDKNALFACDVCFCHDGLWGFSGELFGVGGSDADCPPLPQYCEQILSYGIERNDLAALLSSEEPSLNPKNLLNDKTIYV